VAADSSDHKQIIQIDPDLTSWKIKGPAFLNKWETGKAQLNPSNSKTLMAKVPGPQEMELVNTEKGSLDIYTKEKFGDCIIELEVMVAEKANSGIYVMGRYEIQVKDSFGKGRLKNTDMGGIVGRSVPRTNACAKPGEWQSYRIEFRAPRFENKKRIVPAEFITVELNGEVIQTNIEMKEGCTSGALENKEVPRGPLMLQGGLGAVAFRNIRITPLER
jgi:hypothetical protein